MHIVRLFHVCYSEILSERDTATVLLETFPHTYLPDSILPLHTSLFNNFSTRVRWI